MIVDIIYILWVIRIIANILSYIHLWYVKEYRFDRMFIHLRTKQGKRFLIIPFRRPPVSLKTIVLFICAVFLEAIIILLLPTGTKLLNFFIADLLSFPAVSLFVFVFKIPTFLFHLIRISQAVRKLHKHKNMIVVGITGSYGKTSTKEILYTLVSQKYITLKTETSKNSPIAIAERVLSSLSPDHEVFIVEMGAYKRGEIARMCGMVHPQIALLTAINAQHQDLFGSIDTTMKAKYELVQGLSGRQVLIANVDDPHVKTMATWAKRDEVEVQSYSIKRKDASLFATNVMNVADGIEFVVHWKKRMATIKVHLYGIHQAGNVLAAMAAAIACGMTFDEVCAATKRILPFGKTMNLLVGIHGSMFIDDTYNNNPDAARVAIDFLASQKGRKFLVFQPMIELGDFEAQSHKDVGVYAARVCDEILLTNDNSYESFLGGVRMVDPNKQALVLPAGNAATYLEKRIKKSDVVLFKGRESARILALLQKTKGINEPI